MQVFFSTLSLYWLEVKEHGLILSALHEALMICDVDVCLPATGQMTPSFMQTTRQPRNNSIFQLLLFFNLKKKKQHTNKQLISFSRKSPYYTPNSKTLQAPNSQTRDHFHQADKLHRSQKCVWCLKSFLPIWLVLKLKETLKADSRFQAIYLNLRSNHAIFINNTYKHS